MSVYKRGKVFYMNFTINGQRIFKSTGKTTKREARSVEAAERHKILKQTNQTPQEAGANTLLLDAIEETYSAKWTHGKDSVRSYKRACNLSVIISNIKLSQITEKTVRHLTKTLESRGNSNATVNRYLASLKTILKHMKQPTDFISLRKERKGRIRVLSEEEETLVTYLLRRDHGGRRAYFPEVGDLVEVLLDSGCRLSEALNLHYQDIDFNTGLISIWVNKGDRPRSIPMTRRVRAILEARQESDTEKPFTVKAHQVSTAWNWARKEMGLAEDPEFIPHSLRHTCASRMVNAGVDLYVVKEVLGHASIQVTERYAHLAPHKLADALAALEK
ncbi:integrase [archaeon D22]|nr:integrase [archaeon D22]